MLTHRVRFSLLIRRETDPETGERLYIARQTKLKRGPTFTCLPLPVNGVSEAEVKEITRMISREFEGRLALGWEDRQAYIVPTRDTRVSWGDYDRICKLYPALFPERR